MTKRANGSCKKGLPFPVPNVLFNSIHPAQASAKSDTSLAQGVDNRPGRKRSASVRAKPVTAGITAGAKTHRSSLNENRIDSCVMSLVSRAYFNEPIFMSLVSTVLRRRFHPVSFSSPDQLKLDFRRRCQFSGGQIPPAWQRQAGAAWLTTAPGVFGCADT